MLLVFDTETTGLPQFTKYRGYHEPKNTQFYDKARVLSISWILIDETTMRESDPQTYYIKPDGFKISPESILIHGITEELANEKGVPISVVFATLKSALHNVTHIIAHNISFDVHVLASECHRYNMHALATDLKSKQRYCTMAEGKKVLRLPKNPKLGELYHTLFAKNIENAHDAKYDTLNCCRCFLALIKIANNSDAANVPKVEPRPPPAPVEFGLDADQARVVTSPQGKNTAEIVVACAGSGKTTTIVHRINHLVAQHKVSEDAIILTTFTRNAASNMRQRLATVLGHEPGVLVGTFDSLALQLVRKYASEYVDMTDVDVSEYSSVFVEFLRSNEGKDFSKTISNLFVDEFQDINDVQFEIVRLFHESGANITCVGDDSQSIYAFRDCNVGYMRDFGVHFPGSFQRTMSTNYRCAQPVIDVANACIKASTDGIQKVMVANTKRTTDPTEPKPTVTYFKDRNSQYVHVLKGILELVRLGGGELQEDVAILCPQNRFLFEIEDMLLRHGIHATFVDASHNSSPKAKGQVFLTTIHKAKGLEWDVVYVVMMSNDVMPMSKTPCDVAEGRRLFYVAITRAKRALHMCYSPVHPHNFIQTHMTQFIAELDPQLFVFRGGVQPCHFPTPADNNRREVADQHRHFLRPEATMLSTLKSMRSNGLLSVAMPSSMVKVYEEVPYLDFIQTQDMCHEFDAFVKLLVHRSLCIAYSRDIRWHTASELMNAVYLDYNEHLVYTKYIDNFVNSSEDISMIVAGSNVFKKRAIVIDAFLAKPEVELEGEVMSVVLRILRKLEKTSRLVGLPLHKLHIKKQRRHIVGGGSHVDDAILERFRRDMKIFMDASCNPEDAVWATWQVSLCERMLNSRRRRGLHATVSRDDLMRYARLFELITEYFLPAFKVMTGNDESAAFDVPIDVGGIVDGTMYETVCGQDLGSIILETKARMLCAKQVYDSNNSNHIHSLVIFNPLRGEISKYDVRTFNAT